MNLLWCHILITYHITPNPCITKVLWFMTMGDENKDEMIKVEAVSINVYDRGVDGYFAMVTFVRIWIINKTECHPDGNVWVKIDSIKKRGSVTK